MDIYEDVVKPVRFKLATVFDLERRLNEQSYVGTFHGEVGRFEEYLSSAGFNRNPFAFLKFSDAYGRAEASWVYRKSLFAHRQVHVTLQASKRDVPETRVYAHREDNWIRHPMGHLREKNVDNAAGSALTRHLLENTVPDRKMTYWEETETAEQED